MEFVSKQQREKSSLGFMIVEISASNKGNN